MRAEISSIWGHKRTMADSVTRVKQSALALVALVALQYSCNPSLASDEIVSSNRRLDTSRPLEQVQWSKWHTNSVAPGDTQATQLIRSHRASRFDPNLLSSLTLKVHPINKRAANAINSNADDESSDDTDAADNLSPTESDDYALDTMPALADQPSLHSSPSPSPNSDGREPSAAGSSQAARGSPMLSRRTAPVDQASSGAGWRSQASADSSSPRSSRRAARPAANDDPPADQRAQPTVNLNIGTERLLIKPARERPWATSVTTAATMPAGDQETATESISRHQYASSDTSSASHMQPSSHHHLDLHYPSPHSSDSLQPADQMGSSSRRQLISLMAGDFDARMDQLEANTSPQPANAICYTPVAFALIILVSMTITILVCIFTHLLVKHLGRHQFGKLHFILGPPLICHSQATSTRRSCDLGARSSWFPADIWPPSRCPRFPRRPLRLASSAARVCLRWGR